MPGIPSWARAYLDRQLPGNPVLNGRAISRRRVLANTREGAVLVRRGLLGGVSHEFVETPQDRIAFRCGGCGHNLQFYNLTLPATVYCSICAAKFHVDGAGQVTDVAGALLPSEQHSTKDAGREAMCACCADGCCEGGDCCDHAQCARCCAQSGCCREGCDPATCCPGETCACCAAASPGSAPVRTEPVTPHAPAPVTAFTHNGYTLYRREVETKAGSRPLYFFSKGQPKSGEAAALPEGHEVGVNDRTGLPFLRRGGADPAAPATLHGYKGDSHPVIDVEGIGPLWAERLRKCGVHTTDELGRSDAQALADAMGEAVETIRFWQQMAELMKVKGIGPQYAEALVRSGVHGIDALKERKAAEVAQATNAWLEEQKQTVIKTRLTATRVQGWQKAARSMRKAKLAPHALS
jgi:predicted flap endonuclease-1-like 5' DNA nuclease